MNDVSRTIRTALRASRMTASSLDVASGSAHGLITGMDVLTAFWVAGLFSWISDADSDDLDSRPGPAHGPDTGMNDLTDRL